MVNTHKCFAEFVFEDTNNTAFYLPVIIEVENLSEAEKIYSKINKQLSVNFEMIKLTPFRRFQDEVSTTLLNEVLNEDLAAEPFLLNLHDLKKTSLDIGVVAVDPNITIVQQNLNQILPHNVLSHLEQTALIATKVYALSDLNKDFLVMKIDKRTD